jgi:hypothetical protein
MTYELVKIYSQFNQSFFKGELDNPIYEVNLKKKELFCYDHDFPRKIILGVGFINEKSIRRIFDETLHVMIHALNHKRGIVDRTKNHYHKQEFVDVALKAGLFVGKIGSRGWGFVSSLREDCKSSEVQIPALNKQKQLAEIYRSVKFNKSKIQELQKQLSENNGNKRVFLLKYRCQCPAPHNTVRSGRRPNGKNGLNATCDTCHGKFICEN